MTPLEPLKKQKSLRRKKRPKFQRFTCKFRFCSFWKLVIICRSTAKSIWRPPRSTISIKLPGGLVRNFTKITVLSERRSEKFHFFA